MLIFAVVGKYSLASLIINNLYLLHITHQDEPKALVSDKTFQV